MDTDKDLDMNRDLRTDRDETFGSHVLRVERGHAEPEELAVLTVLLLARTAAGASCADASAASVRRPVAAWRRPERATGFDGPRTWRRAA
ncbi:acyl-CoA carboxylase epsilon subunit [Streptomyces sp. NPDC054796]